MSVLIETSIGDFVIDLYVDYAPLACRNFLKLCKIKYYNYTDFHSITRGFVAQTGDPTGSGQGGECIWSVLGGGEKYFKDEITPVLRHRVKGIVSMASGGKDMNGSQFFFTLGDSLDHLDDKYTIFGEVAEMFGVDGKQCDLLEQLNETLCDEEGRPYKDMRIRHTIVLHDPFPDEDGMDQYFRRHGNNSPEPPLERILKSDRIGELEELEEMSARRSKLVSREEEETRQQEAKANARILEIVGDLPDADVKPPENVLFVAKLNRLTTSEDLELIFSRFGKILNCEVVRDKVTNESLCYAFIEYEEEQSCVDAYHKMDISR
eukprot:Nk52_evm2s386 gene=Nk52_evmTU2s386